MRLKHRTIILLSTVITEPLAIYHQSLTVAFATIFRRNPGTTVRIMKPVLFHNSNHFLHYPTLRLYLKITGARESVRSIGAQKMLNLWPVTLRPYPRLYMPCTPPNLSREQNSSSQLSSPTPRESQQSAVSTSPPDKTRVSNT